MHILLRQRLFPLRRLTWSLAFLLAITLSWRLAQPALAATIRIFDPASCEAAGSRWVDPCWFPLLSVAAGETVNFELDVEIFNMINYGTVEIGNRVLSKRSGTIRARVFEDLVRTGTNLGKRNAGDPWLQGWSINLVSTTSGVVVTQVTVPAATAGLYEATFTNLRPGTYLVCSAAPTGGWIFTMPNSLDPQYGAPCKPIALDPGQSALLLFGAYQAITPARVVAADSAEAVVTDEDQLIDIPYDPAEEEHVHEETSTETASRFFLPLVSR